LPNEKTGQKRKKEDLREAGGAIKRQGAKNITRNGLTPLADATILDFLARIRPGATEFYAKRPGESRLRPPRIGRCVTP
jgi:hypothetical protein